MPARARDRLPAVVLACLGLGVLSLLLPSTPTYDPWAWIIWGREVAALGLDTSGGPSWKPLPVLVTTVFSLAGGAAPFLWVALARAGGLLALAMAYRVASRLAGGTAGVVAGLVAALALLITDGWLVVVALGNSEGLLVAFLLLAVERHLDGHRRQAFGLGVAAALLRPEVWPFLGLYAVYLWMRERESRRLVGLALPAVPILWLAPELWGSGELLRAASRAQSPTPGSRALADDPALEIVRLAPEILIGPVKVGLLAGLAFAVFAFASRRREQATLALAVGGAAWLGVVALMTQAGYAGNPRYLFPAAALGCVVGGIGWARLVDGSHALAARLAWSARRVARARRLAVVVATGALVAFALPQVQRIPRDLAALGFQADLHRDLRLAIDRAGGRERVVACGRSFAGPYSVPLVAWELGVEIESVRFVPDPPGVVFRSSPTRRERAVPSLALIGPRFRRVAAAGDWEVFAACRGWPAAPPRGILERPG